MKKWCYVLVKLGHRGPRKQIEIPVYVFVSKVSHVFIKLRYMGGIHHREVCETRFLNDLESNNLENKVLVEGLSLRKAKNKWYTTYKDYKWW
ncbi:MAG: hypothetical protein NTX24_02910 [Candidatus Pacearchaeota archaeon]|nr:hypothetical protein [Candidatus Pacearchaeota archaeon]